MNKLYSLPNATVTTLRQRTLLITPNLKSIFVSFKNKVAEIFLEEANVLAMENTNNGYHGLSRVIHTGKRTFNKSPFIPVIIIIIFVVIAVYFIGNTLKSNAGSTIIPGEDVRTELKAPTAAYTIQKQFLFPLKDQNGKEVSRLKFFIENAELRDEIIVKGKRALAVKGRTFLIFNLKVTNDYTLPVSINSRDYFRVLVGKNAEKLAPEIHNDPVEIQAISTKYTRIGLPIDDSDKEITLQVGEINGKKENIKFTFK